MAQLDSDKLADKLDSLAEGMHDSDGRRLRELQVGLREEWGVNHYAMAEGITWIARMIRTGELHA